MATSIAEKLELSGVLCVEMFLTADIRAGEIV
ncbi:hypothetical protein ACI3RH_09280 [Lactococcus lactis]